MKTVKRLGPWCEERLSVRGAFCFRVTLLRRRSTVNLVREASER